MVTWLILNNSICIHLFQWAPIFSKRTRFILHILKIGANYLYTFANRIMDKHRKSKQRKTFIWMYHWCSVCQLKLLLNWQQNVPNRMLITTPNPFTRYDNDTLAIWNDTGQWNGPSSSLFFIENSQGHVPNSYKNIQNA